VVGILEDIGWLMKPHFRAAGRDLVLLRASEPGDLTDAQAEFGSSEYAQQVLGALWGFPPSLELEREAALQKCLLELIAAGLLESAHDCSEGGLAVCLAESGFAVGIGAGVDVASGGLPAEVVLFGEDSSRVLLSSDPKNTGKIREIALKYNMAADPIGHTAPENLVITLDGTAVVSAAVSELSGVWESALEQALQSEAPEPTVSSGAAR